MTTIGLVANDQLLQVTLSPKISSGEVNTVKVHVDFSDDWDNFGKSAVFYTSYNTRDIYEMVMTDDECIVPSEVMSKAGTLYIGIRGVNSDKNKVKTTSLVKLKISEGAPTGNSTEIEPTPDVYQQLLTAYEKNDKSINKEVSDRELAISTEKAERKSADDAITTELENLCKEVVDTKESIYNENMLYNSYFSVSSESTSGKGWTLNNVSPILTNGMSFFPGQTDMWLEQELGFEYIGASDNPLDNFPLTLTVQMRSGSPIAPTTKSVVIDSLYNWDVNLFEVESGVYLKAKTYNSNKQYYIRFYMSNAVTSPVWISAAKLEHGTRFTGWGFNNRDAVNLNAVGSMLRVVKVYSKDGFTLNNMSSATPTFTLTLPTRPLCIALFYFNGTATLNYTLDRITYNGDGTVTGRIVITNLSGKAQTGKLEISVLCYG